MTSNTATDLWVSWDEYHRAIESLCAVLARSGWKFEHILCLARGGLRVGDVISRIFGKPLAILATSSYRDGGGTIRAGLDIAQHITSTGGPLGGRVLLVDDLVDSGVTLDEVSRLLGRSYPAITEVRTAVLWWKPASKFAPDYYVERLATNPWIHQPFEDYDTLGPDALVARDPAGNARH